FCYTRRYSGRCGGPSNRAELGPEPIGRGLNDPGAALHGLDGEPPDRSGDAERPDGVAGEVAHWDGHAAHLGIELAIVIGDAAAPDLLDLPQQRRRFGDRPIGRRGERHPLEEMRQLIGRARVGMGQAPAWSVTGEVTTRNTRSITPVFSI